MVLYSREHRGRGERRNSTEGNGRYLVLEDKKGASYLGRFIRASVNIDSELSRLLRVVERI